MWATPYISSFKVTKDEQIPTHSVLELILRGKEEQEEQHYVRTLPSLQKLFDEEMRKKTEGREPKEQIEIIKENKKLLKECMNKEFLQRSEFFDQSKANKDNDGYWRNWSEATEKGWLHFLGHKGLVKKGSNWKGQNHSR